MHKGLLLSAFTMLPVAHADACAVFSPPRQYQDPLFLLDFDAKPQAHALLDYARAEVESSLRSAETMHGQIEQFLQQPNQARLERARKSWREARKDYQRLEWMRFVDGPMDWPEARSEEGFRPAGPEYRLNAWPVNEAMIDYVRGAPKSGLIQDTKTPLTLETLLSNHQASDENNVTTGWHAIEFLLWGQDYSKQGAGQRPVSDFAPNNALAQRRATYLRLVSEQLLTDLRYLQSEWSIEDPLSYYNRMRALPALEVLGPALHGATSLLMLEMHGERFSVPLDSGMQEDEHSCFSDNTLADLHANFAGIVAMLQLDAKTKQSNSLLALLEWKAPHVYAELLAAVGSAGKAIQQLPEPFDQLILAAPESDVRAKAEQALAELHTMAVKLKAASEALGVQIVVPGV